MEITINHKKIQLKFGIRFLRELDKIDGVEVQGQSLGFAIQVALPKLENFDPVTLSDALYAASYEASPRPSRADVDDYVDTCDDLESLFIEIRREIETSNSIKLTAKKLQEISAKNQEA